jgi:hypothetical protein
MSLQDGPVRNCQVAQDRRRTHCAERSREASRHRARRHDTGQVTGRFKTDKQIFADAVKVIEIKPE